MEVRQGKGDELLVALNRDETLVLFEWLSSRTDRNDFPFEDEAERRIVWDMTASFEKILAEPLQPDYADRLAASRARVTSG
jgi:hypothetical protein